MTEQGTAFDAACASVLRGSGASEDAKAEGVYTVECYLEDGTLRWKDTIDNVVTNVGKNLLLDSGLGANVTVVGPYMGLISSIGYTGVPVVGDTMSSHGTWVEAGSSTNYPLYTAPRKTCVWASASGGSKALSAALSFSIITTGGTVKGCFIVTGTGALSTIADTNGVLYSAGVFTGGDKVVGVGDTLQVSYSTSL